MFGRVLNPGSCCRSSTAMRQAPGSRSARSRTPPIPSPRSRSFVRPLDHVVPVSGWHGTGGTQGRGRRCAPGRADGLRPTASRTARMGGPRRRGAPHLAGVGGTVPATASGSSGAVGWRRAMHGGELSTAGATVALPRGDGGARCASARGRTRAASRLPTRVAPDVRARCRCRFDGRGPPRAALPTAAVVLAARGDGAQRPAGCARARRTRRRPRTAGRVRV